MDETELADAIVGVNNRIRSVAIRSGRQDGVGKEVDREDVLKGIERAGLAQTELIVANLFTCSGPDDPLMAAVMKDFCNWMNVNVYRPITEQAVEDLVEKGLAEIRGMDEAGEFTYGLTAMGHMVAKKGKEGEGPAIDDIF